MVIVLNKYIYVVQKLLYYEEIISYNDNMKITFLLANYYLYIAKNDYINKNTT